MKPILKSNKLQNVCYDIRGPVLEHAKRLEEEGHRIIKLNIGNLAPFGFDAPDEVIQDMILNLPGSSGYSDSKGVFAARKAIMHYAQQKGVKGVELDDIYVGNGASELIVMAMQALLNDGDEVLLPAPDYPLWTAAVSLSGGTPIHYICDESNAWMPDLDDIRAKITPNTRAIVVINPNNPTGALYSDDLLRGLADNEGLAHELAEYQTRYGDWRELFRQLNRIDAVSKADIRRVANKIFVASNRTTAEIDFVPPQQNREPSKLPTPHTPAPAQTGGAK